MSRTKAVEAEADVEVPKAKVPLMEALKRYHVKLTFISAILGSAPSSKDVYENYVASKMPEPTLENIAAESALVPEEVPPTGKTIFRVDPDTKGLIFLPHQIRGFLKESASAVTGSKGAGGLTAFKSKIDKWVFVSPDKIFIKRDGDIITKADGTCERPLRAVTAQGPRVSLLSSEQINEGVTVEFDLMVLPLGQKEITQELLQSWLDYGQFQGISQWRNGSYGKFRYELTETTK
jgi:hypothetical protein